MPGAATAALTERPHAIPPKDWKTLLQVIDEARQANEVGGNKPQEKQSGHEGARKRKHEVAARAR